MCSVVDAPRSGQVACEEPRGADWREQMCDDAGECCPMRDWRPWVVCSVVDAPRSEQVACEEPRGAD